jgi:hypothetical protein
MDQKQLDRLPGLVSLRNHMLHMQSWTSAVQAHDTLHRDLCELLGTLDDVSSAVAISVDISQDVAQTLNTLKQNIDQVHATVQSEIDAIGDAVSTKDYYLQHLQISAATREKFHITDYMLTEIAVATGLPDIWRFPTCIVNAQFDNMVEQVLAGDVVYLIDVDAEIIQQQISNVNPAIQSRMKSHKINDWHEIELGQYISTTQSHNRWGLPLGQIAIVLVSGIFERFNLEMVGIVLNQLKPLMRSGGKIFFTVNNADNPAGATNVAIGANGYVTESRLRVLVEQNGLVFKRWESVIAQTVALVEIAMPGTLQSSKYMASRTANKKA